MEFSKIIDNERVTLKDTILDLCKQHEEISIATGYWDLKAILETLEEFKKLKKIRLLIGREPLIPRHRLTIPENDFPDKDIKYDLASLENIPIYREVAAEIKKWIDHNSDTLSNYKHSLDSREYEKESYVYTSMAIHRFQILLCELIKSGKLSLDSNEWKLQIAYDFKCSFDWVRLAIDDFFEWLLPISKIFGENIKKPENIHVSGLNAKRPPSLDEKHPNSVENTP